MVIGRRVCLPACTSGQVYLSRKLKLFSLLVARPGCSRERGGTPTMGGLMLITGLEDGVPFDWVGGGDCYLCG